MEQNQAVAVILKKEDEILLIQDKEIGPDFWSLPEGEVKEKETFLQAAARIIKEETGYILENIEEIGTRTVNYSEYKDSVSGEIHEVVIHFIRGNVSDGKLEINEENLLGAGWFDKAEIQDLQLKGDFLKEFLQ